MTTAYSIEASTPSGAGGERRTGLLVFGIVLLVVGLVAGIGLLVAASSRQNDAVTSLARAPVGCTTTLNFSQTGDFLIFVETEGELVGVRGDCDASGEYSYTGDEPPTVALSMADADGDDLDLRLRSGVDYDAAGFTGRSERVVTITSTGDHMLTVASDDDTTQVAIAVGKDPGSGIAIFRLGAVLAGLAGLIAGVACIVLGSRRRPTVATAQVAGWPAATGWQPSQAGAAPQGGAGAQFPPSGPPQGWPTQPPMAQPPPHPPVSRPPGGQPPGGWAGVSDAAAPQPAAPLQPEGLSGPSTTPRPADGSTGDGERSPWAPPQED